MSEAELQSKAIHCMHSQSGGRIMEYKAQTVSYKSYLPGIKTLHCVMPGGCFMVVAT